MELGLGEDRPQLAGVGIGERDVEGPAVGCVQTVEAGVGPAAEQLAEVGRRDRLAADGAAPFDAVAVAVAGPRRGRLPGCGSAGAAGRVEAGERGVDGDVRGHRWAAGVPGAEQQVGGDQGAELADGAVVAVGLPQAGVAVGGVAAGGSHVGVEGDREVGEPVATALQGDVGGARGLLAGAVGGRGVVLEEQRSGAVLQAVGTFTGDGPRQGLRLDRGDDLGGHARLLPAEDGDQRSGTRQVDEPVGQCQVAGSWCTRTSAVLATVCARVREMPRTWATSSTKNSLTPANSRWADQPSALWPGSSASCQKSGRRSARRATTPIS